jgi:peptide/nickel transport system permease protein
VTGDFGVSIATRRPVILEVSQALANTSLLALFAVPLAFATGYTTGAVAGWFQGRWIDQVRSPDGQDATVEAPGRRLRIG